MIRIIISYLIITIVVFISWTTDVVVTTTDIVKSLENYHSQLPQEKYFVHTDKPYYAFGETIWFKVYGVLSTSHVPITPSGLVYVDLLDETGTILTRRNIRLERGIGVGDIFLDPEFRGNSELILRAYSTYNLNFDQEFIFQKKFNVYDFSDQKVKEDENDSTVVFPSSNLLLSLFPEGGDLVAGIETLLAVKATDTSGKGVQVKGKVFDQNDNLISLFITNKSGFGSFNFRPLRGAEYNVKINYADSIYRFAMPEAQIIGTTMAIKKITPDTIAILSSSNLPNGLNDAFIIGHTRGRVFLSVNLDTVGKRALILPTLSIPEGVAHFTLFQEIGDQIRPMAERLVYINSIGSSLSKQDTISVPRSFIDINDTDIGIKVSLQDSQVLYASMSIQPYLSSASMGVANISTFLYLLSDLTGTIENPESYFENSKVIRPKDLDLLMLTYGWRRFKWKDIISNSFPNIAFYPENGFRISGLTTKVAGKKGVPSEVILSFLNGNLSIISTSSDQAGRFEFNDLIISDTTDILINAQKFTKVDRKRSAPLSITLTTPPYPTSSSYVLEQVLDPLLISNISQTAQANPMFQEFFKDIWSIDLDEVKVSAAKLDPIVEEHATEMLYKEPDARIMVENNQALIARGSMSSVYEMLRGTPGVEIFGTLWAKYAVIRGVGTVKGDPRAMVVLNGVEVDPNILNSLNANEVAFIDVIRNASKAAIYGSNTGVIAVYTKGPASMRTSQPLDYAINIVHPGYYKAREFFSDRHNTPTKTSMVNMGFSTIWWEPNLVFSSDSSNISIPLNRLQSNITYQINFQGITSDGHPVSKIFSFSL